jgi:hypothetical protein
VEELVILKVDKNQTLLSSISFLEGRVFYDNILSDKFHPRI